MALHKSILRELVLRNEKRPELFWKCSICGLGPSMSLGRKASIALRVHPWGHRRLPETLTSAQARDQTYWQVAVHTYRARNVQGKSGIPFLLEAFLVEQSFPKESRRWPRRGLKRREGVHAKPSRPYSFLQRTFRSW